MKNPDSESDRARVIAVLDQEKAAIGASDIHAYYAVLADDAVFLPPGLPALEGSKLRQWLDDFLKGVTVKWLEFAHVETVAVQDIAYHAFTCSWLVTAKAGGDPKTLHFKGLHILRRHLDGGWKIAREIWNTSPASS